MTITKRQLSDKLIQQTKKLFKLHNKLIKRKIQKLQKEKFYFF